MEPTVSRRPTMADVGRMAGVSAATVSFVLNPRSTQSISAATRARVLQAVNDLDYRPNRAAQGLRSRGRTGTIGVIVDESPMEVFAGHTIAGSHDAVWGNGGVLLITHTNRQPAVLRAAAEELSDRQVDGLLYIASGTRRLDPPRPLCGLPCVLVNCFCEDCACPAILPDEAGGGAAAVGQLIAAGHRRIAFLTGRPDAWATVRRLEGHREAIRRAGLDPADQLELAGNYYFDSGYTLTKDVLAMSRRPTGIVCGNDRMAQGAYLALAGAGVRVPADMSVVGYDDHEPVVTQLSPPLSTVRLPLYEMGRMAAAALLNGTSGDLPAQTFVPCPPVRRSSVAPPREDS